MGGRRKETTAPPPPAPPEPRVRSLHHAPLAFLPADREGGALGCPACGRVCMYLSPPVRWFCPYTRKAVLAIDIEGDHEGWRAALHRIGLTKMRLYCEPGPADLPEDEWVDVCWPVAPAGEEAAVRIVAHAIAEAGRSPPPPAAAPAPDGTVVKLAPAALQLLSQLQATGLYGRTIEEAAERLLCERLQQKARVPKFKLNEGTR